MAHLKKTLDEETANHEAAIASMRQKQAHAMEELNDKLDAVKKVRHQQTGRGNFRNGIFFARFADSCSVFLFSQSPSPLHPSTLTVKAKPGKG